VVKNKLKFITIDLNTPEFQKDFFKAEKKEQFALLNTLRKISQLTWPELYIDKGLKWEVVLSSKTCPGGRVYTLRFSQKYRASAVRDGDSLRLLALHTDHDSAYDRGITLHEETEDYAQADLEAKNDEIDKNNHG
jgi:hypothetical protein